MAQLSSNDHGVEPVKAIGLFLGAMLLFSLVDATGKFLTDWYHPVQIVWGRYVFFSLCMLPLLVTGGGRARLVARRPILQIVRGAAMLASAMIFVFSLTALPLAQATAISFASPLFTTMLSIPLLGEQVGGRRWAAVGVGFLGVLIVVRPGTAVFDPMMVLPICSALSWSIGLILTRKMGRNDGPLTTLFYTAAIGIVGSSAMVWPVWIDPDIQGWVLLAALGAFNMAGQFLLIHAFQRAPASMLAPFSYSTMVWAAGLGFVIWMTVPDIWTWIGAAVIAASGLYIWHRERVLYRPVVVPNAAIAAAKAPAAE